MNILQINNFFYPKGGAEVHFLDLIKLLESKGHQVFAFSTLNKKNLKNKNLKFWPRGQKKHFFNLQAQKKLKIFLNTQKIDLAHIHNINRYLTPSILKTLKEKNIPIIMTVHDYNLISPNYNLYLKNKFNLKYFFLILDFYFRKIFFNYNKLIDIFIAPSKFMKDKLVSHNFQNTILIRNFTNFTNDNAKNIKKNMEDKYFLYFGRLAQEKGLAEFIKSLTKIKKTYLFYIIGEGPQELKLKKLVKKLDLKNKIKFLGFKNKKELDQYINQAKFIVLPSLFQENCSLSILEALNHGKKVLATNLGGNSEIINSKFKNGFLYDPKNEKDLLDKINFLIENKELSFFSYEKIKKNAQKKFAVEKYYQRLILIYKNIMENKR